MKTIGVERTEEQLMAVLAMLDDTLGTTKIQRLQWEEGLKKCLIREAGIEAEIAALAAALTLVRREEELGRTYKRAREAASYAE